MQGAAVELLRRIRRAGIRTCFANPGTTEMGIVSALDDARAGDIAPVLCLHETVATGAADGYARMTRAPSATLLHLGPGLANGLANLHNARRAHSPVLCIVGDMATWHAGADALLSMDISALARSVSGIVVRLEPPDSTSATTDSTLAWLRALDDALAWLTRNHQMLERSTTPGVAYTGLDSRVATVIVPHDLSWHLLPVQAVADVPDTPPRSLGILPSAALRFIRDCAAAVHAAPAGCVALYLGGAALLQDGGALRMAGLAAATAGAALLCENAFARVDRGAGLPHVQRLPYFPQEAARQLAQYQVLVTVDTRLPVANFGYKDGPSHLVPSELLDSDAVWELDGAGLPGGVPGCLAALASALGAQHTDPDDLMFSAPRRPERPPEGASAARPACRAARDAGMTHACEAVITTGALTAASLCMCVAALQPAGCVVVDESLTSGTAYWELSRSCPPFSHLTLTGGAIGSGPPLALGAAVACPDKCVINLQADGSAMYSLQALWSQARCGLHVITVICANNRYGILQLECARQRLPPAGAATHALTELAPPTIDWVALAQGCGVAGARVCTTGELWEALSDAIARRGPSLLHCMLEPVS